jgi:hypothetical protein
MRMVRTLALRIERSLLGGLMWAVALLLERRLRKVLS